MLAAERPTVRRPEEIPVTRPMKRVLPVLGLLALASVLLVHVNPPETHYPQPGPVSPKLGSALARLRARIGSTAPELTFRQISDNSLHHLSEFRGRPVLLTVWTTGCGPCWAEMPSLNALQDLYGAHRIAVITLTSSSSESVRHFAKNRGITLPPLSGYSDRLSWVPEAGGRQTQPLTVLIDEWVPNMIWPLNILIDADGTIREVRSGKRSDEELQRSLHGYV
jgi:peroxiredoxin